MALPLFFGEIPMVMIGELAYRTKFDGRELVKGLMSTRQQMAAAKKLAEDTRSPLDKYKTGLENLANMSARYSHVAAKQVELSKQLERQYLEEESALRKLTKSERKRLELLQLPDAIRARSAAVPNPRQQSQEANRKAGLARQSMFVSIDDQQAAGRAALAARLKSFKSDKQAAARSADQAAKDAAKEAEKAAQSMAKPTAGRGMLGIGLPLKLIGGAAAYSYAKSSVLKFAEVEKSSAAFEVLTGSMEKSRKMMEDLRDLAKTGLSFGALTSSAQTMLSFGLASEKVLPTLRALGDISRGDSERLKSLSLAFGQTTAAGRLMGQEVLQMINAGFNPLQEISRTTGRSIVQLKKDMENGAISADMVANSLITATSAGGRFTGMLSKINETSAGSLNSMANKFELMSITLGEKLVPLVKQLSGAMDDLTKSSSGKADSALDIIGNGLAGEIAIVRSLLTNNWGPVSQILDEMDKKSKEAEANAQSKSNVGTSLEREQMKNFQRLREIYAGKNSYATPEDFQSNLTKQRDRIAWYDKAIAKEKSLAAAKGKADAATKIEGDRRKQVAEYTKSVEDDIRLKQFNAKSKIKASNMEELSIIEKMNAQEKERFVQLQKQAELIDKSKKKEKATAEEKARAKSIKEGQKSLADIKKEGLKTAAEVSPTEKLRQRMAELKVQLATGAITRETYLKATNAAAAESIGTQRRTTIAPVLRVGSQEAYQALTQSRDSIEQRMYREQQKVSAIASQQLSSSKEAVRILNEIKADLMGNAG